MTGQRIGIYIADQLRTRTSSQGILNYSLDLVRGLASAMNDDVLTVYSNPEMSQELETVAMKIRLREVPIPGSTFRRVLYDSIGVERWASRDDLDLLHYPKGFVAPTRLGRHARVATIHDDIAIQYDVGRWKSGSKIRWRYFSRSIRRSLSTADHVVTVSEFSKTQLLKWCAMWSLDAPRITVIYPALKGIDPNDAVLPKEPMVLMLGSTLPHKRTVAGLRMILRYLTENDLPLEVLITGTLSDSVAELTRADSRVRVIDRILTDRELAATIRRARALVAPSEYEGFGFPPLEAYSAGTPAVYALNGATRETLDGAPGGFDPDDYASFARAFAEVLEMSPTEVEVVGRSLRRRFTVESMVQQTLGVYRQLLPDRSLP